MEGSGKSKFFFFDKQGRSWGGGSKLYYFVKIIKGAHFFNPSTKGGPELKDE